MGAHTYQTNLTGGEMSPQMFSRSDYKKYSNGAEKLVNMVVRTTGGASRRAGSQFISKSKSRRCFQSSAFQDNAFQIGSQSSLRLVPFVFNTQEAYVLEFSDQYIRFFRNRAPIIGTAIEGAAELIENGTFNTDLANWTLQQDNGATVTHAAPGVALLTVNAGTAGISQAENALTAGTFYVVEFQVEGGNVEFDVGTSLGAADLVAKTTVTPGTYRAAFKAVGTTAFVYLRSSAVNATVRLDNISMKEAQQLELATLYKSSELPQLRFTQSADTLYICHSAHPVRKLIRQSDLVWSIQDVTFSPPPAQEVDILPQATLTPGATQGSGVTFTTDVSVFLGADVNRQIKSGAGVAVIVTVNSGTQVTVDITAPFNSTAPIGAGAWRMDGSPFSSLTLGAIGPVNAIVSVTLATAGLRASDVGGFIIGLSGIAEIVTVTSATAATAQVLKAFTGTTLAAGAWTLEREAWSVTLGFAEVVTFEDQRLWFAKGQTFWGSAAGDFENFGRGTTDNDSVQFTIASNTVDIIRWMKTADSFLIGTIGNEWTVDGGNDEHITPVKIRVKSAGAYGSDPGPDALRAGTVVIFVQRGRKQIRELAFTSDLKYSAADLSILADHLLNKGIIELAQASSPGSFLMALLDDGRIALCTYERPEDVVAWTQLRPAGWEFGKGQYKAMAVIPSKCGSGDEVWTATLRIINGKPDTFIEVLDGQLNTDCALVYDNETVPITSLTGLGHFEGETVDVLHTQPSFVQPGAFQKNAFQRQRTSHFTSAVVGGSVTLPFSSARVEVGQFYESRVLTLRPEIPTQAGTAQFRKKRSNTLDVRFFCSHGDGITVAGESVPRAKLEVGEVADWRKEANLGWDRAGQITIKQTKPFPMTVLGVAYSWQVDDGDS